VLVTHGHHDHFDPSALRQLAQANRGRALFVVPRGLAQALPAECRPFVELDWWEQIAIEGVRVHLVPAQHWHRRGMLDLNKSLWGGYVLEGTHRVYHSGDTGYFGGFRAIGAVFGGIDVAVSRSGPTSRAGSWLSAHGTRAVVRRAPDLSATHFVACTGAPTT